MFTRKSRLSQVEYGLPLRVEETKTVGDGYEVAGYCSTYNNEDHVGDVVMPGAFDKALASSTKTLFLYCHDLKQMLGVPLQLKSDTHGLFGRFRISRTPLGETVHTLMEDGAPFGFSIGFFPDDFEYADSGTRLLKQIDLVENTLAPLPIIANPLAQVTAFKTLLGLPEAEEKAVWDTAYVNNLPDAAFAGIQSGGKKDDEGKTVPRTLRHLPHHDSSVKNGSENSSVDLPHLRNALARVEQMQDGGPEFKARCRSHLVAHAKALNVGDYGGEGKAMGSMGGEPDRDEGAMGCLRSASEHMATAHSHHQQAMASLDTGMQMMTGYSKTFAAGFPDPAEMPFDQAWQDIVNLLTKGLEHTKLLHARRSADGREFGPRHIDALRAVLVVLENAQTDVKALLRPDGSPEFLAAKASMTSATSNELQQLRESVRRKLARHPDLMPLLEGEAS